MDLNVSLWNWFGEERQNQCLPAGSTRYIATITEQCDFYGNDTYVKLTVAETGESWGYDKDCVRFDFWKRRQTSGWVWHSSDVDWLPARRTALERIHRMNGGRFLFLLG